MDVADGGGYKVRRHPNSAVMGRMGSGLAWIVSRIVMAMTGYMIGFTVRCWVAYWIYALATIIVAWVIIYGMY